PLPPHTYTAYNTCQCNLFAEYGSTSVFWAMRLGYSDINMSTGPGQWSTDQHRLMSRNPCNAVTDHQGATDPRLKKNLVYTMYSTLRLLSSFQCLSLELICAA